MLAANRVTRGWSLTYILSPAYCMTGSVHNKYELYVRIEVGRNIPGRQHSFTR